MDIQPTYLDWRSFIKLGDFGDPEKNRQLEEALDQMMLTPEGRDVIQGAYARQGMVRIDPAGQDGSDVGESCYDPENKRIFLDFGEIVNSVYYADKDIASASPPDKPLKDMSTEEKKGYEFFSIQRTLFHEREF